jgi:hypothetical protein
MDPLGQSLSPMQSCLQTLSVDEYATQSMPELQSATVVQAPPSAPCPAGAQLLLEVAQSIAQLLPAPHARAPAGVSAHDGPEVPDPPVPPLPADPGVPEPVVTGPVVAAATDRPPSPRPPLFDETGFASCPSDATKQLVTAASKPNETTTRKEREMEPLRTMLIERSPQW